MKIALGLVLFAGLAQASSFDWIVEETQNSGAIDQFGPDTYSHWFDGGIPGTFDGLVPFLIDVAVPQGEIASFRLFECGAGPCVPHDTPAPPMPSNAPEPGTWALMAGAGVVLMLRRWRIA